MYVFLRWYSLWSPNSLTSSRLWRKLCWTESACYRKSGNTTPHSPYDVQRERNQTLVQMRHKLTCLVDKPEEQDLCLFWLKVLIHPFLEHLSVRPDSSVSVSVLHPVFLYSDFSLFVTELHRLIEFPVGGGLKWNSFAAANPLYRTIDHLFTSGQHASCTFVFFDFMTGICKAFRFYWHVRVLFGTKAF